jgi:hypothetical protein
MAALKRCRESLENVLQKYMVMARTVYGSVSAEGGHAADATLCQSECFLPVI